METRLWTKGNNSNAINERLFFKIIYGYSVGGTSAVTQVCSYDYKTMTGAYTDYSEYYWDDKEDDPEKFAKTYYFADWSNRLYTPYGNLWTLICKKKGA